MQLVHNRRSGAGTRPGGCAPNIRPAAGRSCAPRALLGVVWWPPRSPSATVPSGVVTVSRRSGMLLREERLGVMQAPRMLAGSRIEVADLMSLTTRRRADSARSNAPSAPHSVGEAPDPADPPSLGAHALEAQPPALPPRRRPCSEATTRFDLPWCQNRRAQWDQSRLTNPYRPPR